jgi:mitogen-activated protein kinase kinase kinase 7
MDIGRRYICFLFFFLGFLGDELVCSLGEKIQIKNIDLSYDFDGTSSDFVSQYYRRYLAGDYIDPIIINDKLPADVTTRLEKYGLHFKYVPGLLQYALLWDHGYALGDPLTLTKIYTKCIKSNSTNSIGISMKEITVSREEFTSVAGCQFQGCIEVVNKTKTFARSHSCRTGNDLNKISKCASTFVNKTSIASFWADGGNQSHVPNVLVRRHLIENKMTSTQSGIIYGIHTGQGEPIELDTCPATGSMIIPCIPYNNANENVWCSPSWTKEVDIWLEEYSKEAAKRQDVSQIQEKNKSEYKEDENGVFVKKGFQYDGKTSDLAQQYYRLYLSDPNGIEKVSLKDQVPSEIEERLKEFELDFDDLPAYLQQAVIWDTGYAFDDETNLVQVYTKCGLGMEELAISLEDYEFVGCKAQTCNNTTNGEKEESFYRSLFCNGYQITPLAKCASVEVRAPVHAAMWSYGNGNGNLDKKDQIPTPYVSRHAWEDTNQSYLIYAIHTVKEEVPYGKCPSENSIILPCVYYNASDEYIQKTFCRPHRNDFVNSWLQSYKTKFPSKSNNTLLYAILIPCFGLTLLFVGIMLFYIYKRKLVKKDGDMTIDGKEADEYYLRGEECDNNDSLMPNHTNSFIQSNNNNIVLQTLTHDPNLIGRRIPFEQIELGSLLSKGAYGEVWRCTYQGEEVAVKRLLQTRQIQYSDLQAFTMEIQLTASLDHPNIIRMIGVAWNTLQNLYMVIEFLENGDLQDYLKKHGTEMSWEKEKMQIAIDIMSGLSYLHHLHPPVIHRDIKSRNVLLSSELEAKLIDFGISRNEKRHKERNQLTAGVGTPYWTAPEILKGSSYNEKADIYSFGVVLSEMDTCQMPYSDAIGSNGENMHQVQILQKVLEGNLQPNFLTTCPQKILQIAKACLELDPILRPSAKEILQLLLEEN